MESAKAASGPPMEKDLSEASRNEDESEVSFNPIKNQK